MRYLLHFLWKNYAFFLFLILELFSLVLVVNANKHQSVVFSNIANQYGGKVFSSYTNTRNYFHLKEANSILAAENARLKKQIQALHLTNDSTQTQEFRALDSLLIANTDSLHPVFDFIAAKVVSNSTNRQKNYIMLHKGRKDGVRENMGIIGPNGIAGVIFETSEDYSSGISLLNIKLNVSAKLKNSNELGTLIWDGKSADYGKLDAIENYVPLHIGDTVVTSGFSHIFPEGERIGTIADFKTIPGKTAWDIKVKYLTDFSRLYWVNIVRNQNYEQQKQLESIKIEE